MADLRIARGLNTGMASAVGKWEGVGLRKRGEWRRDDIRREVIKIRGVLWWIWA